jgi:hypothetical protein
MAWWCDYTFVFVTPPKNLKNEFLSKIQHSHTEFRNKKN